MQNIEETCWSKLFHLLIVHQKFITAFLLLLAVIIVAMSILIIVLPYLGIVKFSIAFKIFNVCKNIFIAASIFAPVIIFVLGCIDRKTIKDILAILLSTLLLCIITAISAYVGFAILEDKYIEESKNVSNDNFEFKINFDDLLFTSYSTSDLRNHKDALKKHIMSAVNTANENNINANDSGKKVYEDETRTANDFEEAYIILRKNGMLKDEFDERIRYNDKSIDHRLTGNENYKDSTNQSTLVSRYDDGADEYYNIKNYDQAIEYFTEGLRWGLIGTATSYEESNGEHSAKSKQIVDKMIKIYKKLSEYDEFSTDTRNRAEILVEVMKSIKNEL